MSRTTYDPSLTVRVLDSLNDLRGHIESSLSTFSQDRLVQLGVDDALLDVTSALKSFSSRLSRASEGLRAQLSRGSLPLAFELVNLDASYFVLDELLRATERAKEALNQIVSRTRITWMTQPSSGLPHSIQAVVVFNDEAAIPHLLKDLSNACTSIWHSYNVFHLDYALKDSFVLAPFDSSPQECLSIISHDESCFDRCSIVMKKLGTVWVDYNTPTRSGQSLMQMQLTLLQNLESLFEKHMKGFVDTLPDAMPLLFQISRAIKKELNRERTLKFSTAFCGMVKAGKSLFINTLIGAPILPSDELPSTSWPCRLRHVKGQDIPTLEIDAPYFQAGIERLKSHKFGAMMANFKAVQDEDPFGVILDCSEDDASFDELDSIKIDAKAEELNIQRTIYSCWVDLDPSTKANLLKFEDEDFRIQTTAQGCVDVTELLAQLNDVVRLCKRLDVPLPSVDTTTWPLLTVEFEVLRDLDLHGTFEFIDLPGIGEASFGDYHSFEDLLRRVANEANAVVPIVSLKEVAKDDWRQQLPNVIKTGLGRAPELVLCTHLDQTSGDRLQEQVASVAKVFWPKSESAVDRVLCCSSRLGMSSRALLRQSEKSKPSFEEMWVEGEMTYDCAEKILGVGNPQGKYEQLRHEEWKKAINYQLKESRLETAISRLTTELVDKQRIHALLVEVEQLRRDMSRFIIDQQRLILDTYRSSGDFETAFQTFMRKEAEVIDILGNWQKDEAKLQRTASSKLVKAFKISENRGFQVAAQAVENTSQEFFWLHMSNQAADLAAPILTFRRNEEVSLFLRSVQRGMEAGLAEVKRSFVAFVRELAARAQSDRFSTLKAVMEQMSENGQSSDLMEDVIRQLSVYGHDAKALVSRIQPHVVRTIASRHGPTSAFNAIQNAIAKPFLQTKSPMPPHDLHVQVTEETSRQSHSSWSSSLLTSEDERQVTVDDLGFMLRAPIAVLAAVPLVLGSAIWPFIIRGKQFVIDKAQLTVVIKERIISPYLEGLKTEASVTLEAMIRKSSQAARVAVVDALVAEENRFVRARYQKESWEESQKEEVTNSCLSVLLNLLAAEAALQQLQHWSQ
ncbi:hypothetical protein HYDPIDRAFT_31927 [Hydnomerulius pinastri MD-312]|uniref:Dynamin N-terminal domain-containing protein n=1 Tax=Hydnomerulius pinastri MD-312 TaxID=994086 RepID=A0A0C9WBJ3_9AGAM|nr:hypothetical protein HYDPIDRAFT_31927 [Hydnomerulius pinastri MD-312]